MSHPGFPETWAPVEAREEERMRISPNLSAAGITLSVVAVLVGGYLMSGAQGVALVGLALLVGTRVALWERP